MSKSSEPLGPLEQAAVESRLNFFDFALIGAVAAIVALVGSKLMSL